MNIQQEIIDAPVPQPVAWVRFRSDGCYEGPLMDVQMEDSRKKSGAWTPLYTNLQSGEYHVSDYDDDYRGPERALWHIEPVYCRTKGQR